MSSDTYLLTADEIAAMPGLAKTHFLNPSAKRINKSLGDATGLTGLGIHLIEVAPGGETTEYHVHHYEDEAIYVLSGTATASIGEETHAIGPGDFIGYRAGGLAHTIVNTGDDSFAFWSWVSGWPMMSAIIRASANGFTAIADWQRISWKRRPSPTR